MKAVLGENHPTTLTTMNGLANTYGHLGKHSDAVDLLKQCLDKRKVILGENYPQTLDAMNSLAIAYCRQGMHLEGVDLFKQCLDKRKVVLGENHPDTLKTMGNLANMNNLRILVSHTTKDDTVTNTHL